MPKVDDAHRAARRDEILDAAQRVLARKGYRGSSIAAIITESGLSAGAIYGYFDGKEDLFHAVAERVMGDRVSELAAERGTVPRSPGEIMRDFLRGMRGLPVLDVGPQIWAEATVEPAIQEIMVVVFGRLKGVIQEELTDWATGHPERIEGDPAAWAAQVSPIIFASAPGFILQRLIFPDFDEEAYLAALPLAFRG